MREIQVLIDTAPEGEGRWGKAKGGWSGRVMSNKGTEGEVTRY